MQWGWDPFYWAEMDYLQLKPLTERVLQVQWVSSDPHASLDIVLLQWSDSLRNCPASNQTPGRWFPLTYVNGPAWWSCRNQGDVFLGSAHSVCEEGASWMWLQVFHPFLFSINTNREMARWEISNGIKDAAQHLKLIFSDIGNKL